MTITVQLTIAIRIKLSDLSNQITEKNINQIMSLIINPNFHCKDAEKSFQIISAWENHIYEIMDIESEDEKVSALKQFIENFEYKNYYINLIPSHPNFNKKLNIDREMDNNDLTDSTNEKYIIDHERHEEGFNSTYAKLESFDIKKDRAVNLVNELSLQSDYEIVFYLKTSH